MQFSRLKVGNIYSTVCGLILENQGYFQHTELNGILKFLQFCLHCNLLGDEGYQHCYLLLLLPLCKRFFFLFFLKKKAVTFYVFFVCTCTTRDMERQEAICCSWFFPSLSGSGHIGHSYWNLVSHLSGVIFFPFILVD